MLDRRTMGVAIVVAFAAFVLVGRWAVERRTGAAVADAAEPAPEEATGGDSSEIWRIPFGGAPGRGPAEALVTIVVFSDLADAGRRLETMVDDLQAREPREIRWAIRFVAGAPTALAAEALLAAQSQNKYFELRQALGPRIGAGLRREAVEAAARAAGLDVTALGGVIDSGKAGARSRADARLAASLGVTRPTLFVNGQKVDGTVSAAELERIVARQRQRAGELVRRGVPRERVYAELTKSGRADLLEPGTKRPPRRREDPDAIYRVDIGDSPVKGPDDALVTIVEFGDFQCPFCGRAATALRELATRYPREVRLVWKDSPLSSHPEARSAAVAGRAAHEQGKFWQMHDALFAAQDQLGRETYERLAREMRLDMDRFHADLGTDRLGKRVVEEGAVAARLGVVGTPVFFVNGKRLRGFRDPQALVALVEAELARARALVRDEHVRAADLYERATANGARRSVLLPDESPRSSAE